MTRRAQVVVLTGAGISADSGLATFRDAGGLWEGHRPEEVATPEAWSADPAMVWRFYQARRAMLGSVEPNPGHFALAEFEKELVSRDVGYRLITQNVDDLHERAGSGDLLHMHGELAKLRCESCGHVLFDLERTDGAHFIDCPACLAVGDGPRRLRPDVVWFGEVPYHLDEIAHALANCTHFLAIGTSGAVYPAAGFLAEVRRRGAATWIQALEAPDNADPRDELVLGRGRDVLPGMLSELATRILG